MSSSTRTTSKGGKISKGDANKSHKHDKSDASKASGDKQQHSGGSENARSKSDDPGIKEKVRQVMEMTRRSEEEVCLVLHECDHDAERAINMFYENFIEVGWETSKKKKNRQASTSKPEIEEAAPVDEWNETSVQANDKEKPRNKSGNGPPRLHGRHNDSRGWRGRENKENERNLDDGNQQERKDRRGRLGGHTRGSGGRGRGGGRAGSRYPPRNNRNNFANTRTIDTWDNATTWESTTITNSSHTNFQEENWDDFPQTDDWSTEEYTGSLADTKVFTPSMSMTPQMESGIEPKSGNTPVMPLEMSTQIVGTLNAAQTQYLNQLTQQSSENIKASQYNSSTHPSQGYANNTNQQYNTNQVYVNSSSTPPQQYSSSTQQYGSSPGSNTYASNNYVANNTYGTTETSTVTHQPVRIKTQRARVPPPSKIPATAVEMPGDLNSSIGYLDVQFGAMDFMSESGSFEGTTDNKFSPTNDANVTNTNQLQNPNLDLNQATQNSSLDAYSTSKSNTQNSISSALSQSLTNTDIPQTSEHLPGSYNCVPRSTTAAVNTIPTVTPSGLDMNKQNETHPYTQSSSSSSYNSYQQKTTTYQTQTYSSSNYSTPQTTANSYANNSAQSYNTPSATNNYQNSYSSVSSYQTNTNSAAFPAISQANSYPANNQFHQQTSQSVYGANTAALNNSSNYGNTSGNQYSNYNTNSNKLVKEGSYDNTSTVSNTTTTTSSANTSTLTQTTTTGTKSTTTLAKNTSNVMSNIPPAGVTPVMSTQYIMGQVPYFQQPIYSFEEMQLLQQRIPHMATGYFDMSYQTPTTLATVRDGTLANVAYSISDGRFTRGDNNTSPVPSTLSQQTSTLSQAHQAQPMLAAQTGGTPFFYAHYNPMQPTYQFGAVYPQLPTVTNAHGSNNSQYPKPASYGSGYGSGYDPLTQSQDYSKGGYVGNAQNQNKGSSANASSGGSSSNDLSAMYGKTHTALGKVNSYDKQGFHSGTPPPFTGALHGNQSTGLAPSGTSYGGAQMFIPTMAPHQQHHSTQLIHQPLHQDSSNNSGQRSQASTQGKSGAKQAYQSSYWNQA